MQKQKIEYNSNVDALVAVSKRLSQQESKYQMSSENFFDSYSKGNLGDTVDFVEWSNDYQHFLAIRSGLEKQLKHVA